jgi:hypothetical protein
MFLDFTEGAIRIFSHELRDQSRNPLAFAHEGLNLVAAQAMSKLVSIILSEGMWHRLPTGEPSQPRWLCHERK